MCRALTLGWHIQTGSKSHVCPCFLERALGTSWEKGVRLILLVRLCLGPPAGEPDCRAVCGHPVRVRSPW